MKKIGNNIIFNEYLIENKFTGSYKRDIYSYVGCFYGYLKNEWNQILDENLLKSKEWGEIVNKFLEYFQEKHVNKNKRDFNNRIGYLQRFFKWVKVYLDEVTIRSNCEFFLEKLESIKIKKRASTTPTQQEEKKKNNKRKEIKESVSQNVSSGSIDNSGFCVESKKHKKEFYCIDLIEKELDDQKVVFQNMLDNAKNMTNTEKIKHFENSEYYYPALINKKTGEIRVYQIVN
jgi:hypothetical protein